MFVIQLPTVICYQQVWCGLWALTVCLANLQTITFFIRSRANYGFYTDGSINMQFLKQGNGNF